MLQLSTPQQRMKLRILLILISAFLTVKVSAQKGGFDGIGTNMDNLYRLSDAQTRSISPENPTGEKGKGGMAKEGTASGPAKDLGPGWKINPFIRIAAHTTYTLAEIDGGGALQHIWMTPTGNWRYSILRMYWDDEKEPSVEVPVGDFFAAAYEYKPITSLAVCVNPGSAFNSYWVMPFRKKCRITMENIADEEMILYYQIDYTRTTVPEDAAYFHAQFRRVNPVPYKEVYTVADGIKGKGHYVGTYMLWQSNSNGWWGEGEIKFYMDGDTQYPTICGTGTEDYFCGSYAFAVRDANGRQQYEDYSTPYAGFHAFKPDGAFRSQAIFGMYRWHITDPVRFNQNLKITIQALGWRSGMRYLPLQDDISSVAFWYQTEPHAPFPKIHLRDGLEIVR